MADHENMALDTISNISQQDSDSIDFDLLFIQAEQTQNFRASQPVSSEVPLHELGSRSSLPTYSDCISSLSQAENGEPPRYSSLYSTLPKSFFLRFFEIIKARLTMFYLADFVLNLSLICLAILYYNNYGVLSVCLVAIFTSFFSMACNFFRKETLYIYSCLFKAVIIFGLLLFLATYVLKVFTTNEEWIFALFCIGYLFSFVCSLVFMTIKEEKIRGIFGVRIFVAEQVILLIPLTILAFYEYISILCFIGTFISFTIFLIIYISLMDIVKDKEDRTNIRRLFYKDVLVYYIFLASFFLVKLNGKLEEVIHIKGGTTHTQ